MSKVPWLIAVACACGGATDDGTASGIDPAEEACYHIAEGQTVDGAATPDDAPMLEAGLDPYRVVLVPDAPTYVLFSTGPGTLVLAADTEQAVSGVTSDGAELQLGPSGPNPTCEQDLLTLVEVEVGAGEHIVELADSYKATVWLLGAVR